MNEEMTSTPTIPAVLKILIAEDHELARNGLAYSLQKRPDFDVVAEVENGQDAVSKVRQLHPDVVLMDIGMPVMDGIQATHEIKAAFPQTKVIMLTSHQEGEEVYAALAAGADAYCMKDIKTDRLAQVVQMVYEGAVWLDPAIARLVMTILPVKLPEKMKQAGHHRQHYKADLTERELEVLNLIVEGQSNKEIALALSITLHTVKAHVCNIIQKLAVDDRTQAAVKALRDGLIQKGAG